LRSFSRQPQHYRGALVGRAPTRLDERGLVGLASLHEALVREQAWRAGRPRACRDEQVGIIARSSDEGLRSVGAAGFLILGSEVQVLSGTPSNARLARGLPTSPGSGRFPVGALGSKWETNKRKAPARAYPAAGPTAICDARFFGVGFADGLSSDRSAQVNPGFPRASSEISSGSYPTSASEVRIALGPQSLCRSA
jgi:hypothetical protein